MMFLLFLKMKLWRNESLLVCGFERFRDEEMIDIDRGTTVHITTYYAYKVLVLGYVRK